MPETTSPTPCKTLLFLCTGNYYRSRFAEILFNDTAEKLGLLWTATSRGLALERGINNVGPMAANAREVLAARGIGADAACSRFPIQATVADFEAADWIVALQQSEHLPLLEERYSAQGRCVNHAWADKIEFWDVEDAPHALPLIEREVLQLAARLQAWLT